jgi:hypothetical protein
VNVLKDGFELAGLDFLGIHSDSPLRCLGLALCRWRRRQLNR